MEKLFLGWWSIVYLMCGTIRSYRPAHWLDYHYATLCAWYYTSCCIQQTWSQNAKCTSLHASKYALKYTPDCTWLYTPSLLNLHSQDASKYTLSMLPSTPPSTFSSSLPGILSRMLPVALDGTLPACLTVCFHVSSQDALKHTPKHTLKYTPNCTWWHTPCLLDICSQAHLWVRSEVHSWACSKGHSQLHLMVHS
jgi:hypothetical protein